MRFLASPRWVIGHILVLVLGFSFVSLGFWQLGRWDERRLANSVNSARYEADVMPLDRLLTGVGGEPASLEFRRAVATGVFVPHEEVLLRSQVRDTRAGFAVVTPLVLEGGGVVMVDRGWVPLEFDTVPVAPALPPDGWVTVEGVVRLSQERSSLGHDDFAEGPATTISRVDINQLDAQVSGDLAPVYLQIVGEVGPTELPVPAPPPDLTGEGPHRDYALQWFGFALVAAVGYGFLLRRAARHHSADGNREPIDHLNVL